MNLNYSMFYNCVCSLDGGAISSLLLIHLSEWYVLIVTLVELLLAIILLIFMPLKQIKWNIYQYQIALILHLELFQFAYKVAIRQTITQTIQWTMQTRLRVFVSILHLHSQVHTALSQTTRYLSGFAYTSIQPQEQYQCHMLTLFITTVHLDLEL